MDFSSRLNGLREDSDMKQYELANLLNLKPSAVSKYEKGHAQPGMSTIIQIAEIFNVSVDYLLGISSMKNPYGQDKFTPKEADIIFRYRKLSKSNQIRIDERINTLLETQRKFT